MAVPSEHEFIEKCKLLIECRLEWSDSGEWKNSDFEYLSELIYRKTKVSISVSTLKRIWLNNIPRKPHISTLHALAGYLDYENWYDFKSKVKGDINPNQIQKNKITSGKSRLAKGIIPIVLLLTVLVSVFLILRNYFINKEHILSYNPDDIVFTSRKTVTSGLPNTVVFNYDISKADFDSAFIQQDWDRRKRTRITKDNHYHTSIYYYPFYYKAKLILNDSVVKTFPIHIITDGWLSLYSNSVLPDMPVYLQNINVIKENRLFVSVEDLEVNKIVNDRDFFIYLFNSKDFGEIYSDNFRFESEIKNDPRDGGLTCQISAIVLIGEDGMMYAIFGAKGCTSQLEIMFGDYGVGGSNNDLSALGADFTDWRNVTYNVTDKNVSILIDKEEVYNLSFNTGVGKITGIGYVFYGCGSVRKSKLFDKNGNLVYEEKF